VAPSLTVIMSQSFQDQIRKLLFLLIAFAALVYSYITFFLGPLQHTRNTMTSGIAGGETKLVQAAKTIKEVETLETTAQGSVTRMAQLNGKIPPGAPVAWFPPLVRSLFASDNIEIGLVRLLNSAPLQQGVVTKYAKTDWTVEIPQIDFSALGSILARLETEQVLSNITSVHIRSNPDHPEFQSANLGLIRVVKE
jgi:hypothetical protein